MSKKLVHPIAKIREDKCPAIWLTYGVWSAIRNGLANTYITSRERHGRSEARIASGKRDAIFDSWRTETRDAETALELYRIGWAYNHPDNQNSDLFTSPEKLVEIGDKCEARAAAEQLEAMREGPTVVTDKAGQHYYETGGRYIPIDVPGRERSRWELDLVAIAK